MAQTRQADRDKAHADADAQHREDLARANDLRLALATKQGVRMVELLQQNTKLTEVTHELSQRIETLTREMHGKFVLSGQKP